MALSLAPLVVEQAKWRMRRFLSLVLLVTACDPSIDRRRPPDADAQAADVALADASFADTSFMDAVLTDASTADAPLSDAAMNDAAPGDVGSPDVLVIADAGADVSDAGSDAGSDSGPDAGPPDAGFDAGCGGEVCSFFPACGCGAQACFVQESGAPACAAPGAGTTGMACTTFDSCAAGLYCSALPTGERQCTPLCQVDGDCPGAGAVCIRDTAAGGVQACSFNCDLRTQAGCPAMAYCSPLNGDSGIVTDCRGPAGDGGRGASCTSNASCQRGFTCARESAGAPLTCRQWCRAGRDSDCDRSSDECITGSPEIRVGSQEYGICVS